MANILDTYRRSVHSRIQKLKENAQEDLISGAVYRRSTHATPATTSEEVAIVALTNAARIRAYQEALEVIEDAYKMLFKEENDE